MAMVTFLVDNFENILYWLFLTTITQNPEDLMKEQKAEDTKVNVESRREFCKKAIKRSSIAAAVGVAGYLAYKKPEVRSFFGARDAYAGITGTGFDGSH